MKVLFKVLWTNWVSQFPQQESHRNFRRLFLKGLSKYPKNTWSMEKRFMEDVSLEMWKPNFASTFNCSEQK